MLKELGLVADRKWDEERGLAGVCVAREDDIDRDVQHSQLHRLTGK